MGYGCTRTIRRRLSNCRGEVSAASTYLMTVMLVTGGAVGFQRAFTRAYTNFVMQQLSVLDDLQGSSQRQARLDFLPR